MPMPFKTTLANLALTLAFTGCASVPPPIATRHGIVDTVAFEPLFISTAPGEPKKLLFKSTVTLYEGTKAPALWSGDILAIADTGVYVVEWNPQTAAFTQKLFIRTRDIENATVEAVPRSIVQDSASVAVQSRGQTFKLGLGQQLSRNVQLLLTDLAAKRQ